jgi:hypothetical protein
MTLNTKTRRVLAVMAVTTALCADQVAVAAPARAQRTEIGQMASRLVSRLTQSLRQGMPSVLAQPARQQRPAAKPARQIAATTPLSVGHALSSPFQFRLPPPIL